MTYVVASCMFRGIGREVVVRFVDNGGMVDHYCLIFIFETHMNMQIQFYDTQFIVKKQKTKNKKQPIRKRD